MNAALAGSLWAAKALRFHARVGEALGTAPDLHRALETVARLAVPELADWCAFYVRDETEGLVPVALAYGDEHLTEAAWHAAREYAQHAEDPEPLRSLGLISSIVAPLSGRERSYGLLQFGSHTHDFGEDEQQFTRDIAKRMATALDVGWLIAARQRGIDRLRFLAEVGEALGDSLDLNSRFTKLLNFVVPRMGTWAAVNVVQDDGSIETVAIAHRDPAMTPVIERLRGPYYGHESSHEGTPEVIRTGRSHLIERIDERYLRRWFRPETLPAIRELGSASAIIVPLTAHARTQGSLAVVRSEDMHPFAQNDVPLFEEIARRAAIAIENAQLFKRQQTVADTFQNASLPASLPQVAGFTLSGFYEPGKTEALVGGDWYDAFTISDGRIVVSIGDVSGNGLQAAVIMGSVRQLIRGAAQIDPNPSVVLDATDQALRVEHPDHVVTAFVGILDPVVRTLTYASAGHPPPFLRYGDGRLVELEAVGLPLGLRDGDAQHAQTVELRPGCLLALYTDGLIESTRDLEEGERRLRAALESEAVANSADPAKAVFEGVLYDGSFDDVAILAIRVGKRAGAADNRTRFRRRFASTNAEAARSTLTLLLEHLHARATPEPDCDGAAAVYLELVGNVVRHAPGTLEVAFDWTGLFPVLHVLDDGPGFERPWGAGLSEVLAESGRGLFLASHFARGLQIRRRGIRGSHARAVLAVHRIEG